MIGKLRLNFIFLCNQRLLVLCAFFSLFLLSSCFSKGKIDIVILDKNKIEVFNANVSNVQIINNQIILTGTNLNDVTNFKIKNGSVTTALQIESKSNTSLIANTITNINFGLDTILDFVISSASAASTFQVNFSLCDSLLGEKGFDCLLVPNDKDVLSFDANTNKWIPRNVNGLNYVGVFDASPGIVPGGSPFAGDYYIISVTGTINSVSYAVGDWIVYNADEIEWQKVSNSKDVLSVFGRTGKISAREGDYNLTKMSDVDLTTVVPVLDQILKFNGTNWVPSTLVVPSAATGSASSPGYSFTGNSNTGIFSPGTNQVAITNNGVESVRVNAAGNVGIGTSNPGYLLSVQGKANGDAIRIDGTSNCAGGACDNVGLILANNGTGGFPWSINSSGNSSGYGQGKLVFTEGGIQSGTARLTIASGGNVGIGTATPRSKLEVNGSVQIGVDAAACSASNAGAMRFATPSVEFCNGSAWTSISGGLSIPNGIQGGIPWYSGTGAISTSSQLLLNGIVLGGGTTAPSTIGLGTANYVLTSNGVGGPPTWQAPTGGLPAAVGSASLPSYSFTGFTTTGMFHTGTDILGFSTTGAERVRIDASGSVGIGTTSPAASLDVAGDIKVGNSSATCNATTKGSIRYNNTTSVLEFCNGTAWNLIQAAACTDPNPNVISFTDEANATANTVYTAATILVSGINCSVPVTISGQGGPQYQICSDSGCSIVVQGWTSSPSSITNNQYIQTRLTTDNVGGSTFKATVIVGSGASVWSVTTVGGDCTASPTPGTICADGTIYAGLSPDGNVKMFTTRCDAGQTWDGVNCTGSRTALNWNNGTSNWFATGVTGSITGKANSNTLNGLVDIGAPYIAAQYCESLSQDGRSDWYLPALAEMHTLYNNKLSIKNFEITGSWYAVSTEVDNTYVITERLSDGVQYGSCCFPTNTRKSVTYLVRCVRR